MLRLSSSEKLFHHIFIEWMPDTIIQCSQLRYMELTTFRHSSKVLWYYMVEPIGYGEVLIE